MPNKRHAFAKMEERRKNQSQTTRQINAEEQQQKEGGKAFGELKEPIALIPSVEEIELPASKKI